MSKGARLNELLLYSLSPISIIATAPLLARGLGPESRGEFGVLQAVASIALSIGALGQAEVLLADKGQRSAVVNAISIAFSGCVLSAFAAAFALNLMKLSGINILAALVLLPIAVQGQIFRSVAVSRNRLIIPAIANGLGALGRIVLLAILFLFGSLNTFTAIFSVQLALVLASAWCYRGFLGPSFRRAGAEFTLAALCSALRKGAPLVLFSLFTAITLRADLIVLKSQVDPVQLGSYAATTSLTVAVLSISPAFKSRVQAVAVGPQPRARVRAEVMITITFAMGGSLLLVILAPIIVPVLLGPEYPSAVRLMQFLSVSCGALLVLDVAQGLLVAIGGRRQLIYGSVIGASVTLSFLLLLVPHFGVYGAAVSISCGYCCVGVSALLSARKLMRSTGRS